MLDTVRLRSPKVEPGVAWQAEQSCQRRMGIEISTGEKLYEITTGSLQGSFDERVSVRVMREEWVVVEGQKQAVQVACEPYVLIEGSVHKALMGHNVWGGPTDPVAACRWLVADVGERLGVQLPDGGEWTVQRVDWSEVYELPSFEAVQEYMHGLNSCSYPRRQVTRFGDTGIHAPGGTTTVKIYHKGPEFSKHDRKRLKARLGLRAVAQLQEHANRLLRFEVEVHARKLDEDFGHKPTVREVTRQYLEGVHDREGGRLLREGQGEMRTVRTSVAVSRRLREMYAPALANTLFGTWMQLSALGEEEVKRTLSRRTFYRQRKQLEQASVSWKGSDIRCIAQLLACPEDFSPVRTDVRRLLQVAPEVGEKLEAFSLAA